MAVALVPSLAEGVTLKPPREQEGVLSECVAA